MPWTWKWTTDSVETNRGLRSGFDWTSLTLWWLAPAGSLGPGSETISQIGCWCCCPHSTWKHHHMLMSLLVKPLFVLLLPRFPFLHYHLNGYTICICRIALANLRQSSSFSSRLLSTTRPTVLACLCGEWGTRAGSRNIYTCGKISAFDLHEFRKVVKSRAQLTVSADELHESEAHPKLLGDGMIEETGFLWELLLVQMFSHVNVTDTHLSLPDVHILVFAIFNHLQSHVTLQLVEQLLKTENGGRNKTCVLFGFVRLHFLESIKAYHHFLPTAVTIVSVWKVSSRSMNSETNSYSGVNSTSACVSLNKEFLFQWGT